MVASVRFDFTDTTTVVTGGSSGIGLACALAIVEAGGNVVITASRNSNKTASAIKSLNVKAAASEPPNTNNGRRIEAHACEIGDEESVANFFENILKTNFGRVDYVIHSAGISPNTEFFGQSQKEWDMVQNINSTGSFLVTKYAAKLMQNQKKVATTLAGYESRGTILLISSTNGINSNDPISAHYDSSKAAVNILVRNAAEMLADDNIIVNGLAPGWVETELNATLPTDIREKESAKIWMKRWATPEEIAMVAMHILTMPYYMGQILLADGGYR